MLPALSCLCLWHRYWRAACMRLADRHSGPAWIPTSLQEGTGCSVPGNFPACMAWPLASQGSPSPNMPSKRNAGEHLVELALCLQEDRQWALVRGLEHINREIEGAAGDGVPCWFPMGTRDERILRLPAKEAILLNSRCACTCTSLIVRWWQTLCRVARLHRSVGLWATGGRERPEAAYRGSHCARLSGARAWLHLLCG